ncbi:MAG: hypothetical protein ACK2UQ_07065 [Anaerolineae bacterium]
MKRKINTQSAAADYTPDVLTAKLNYVWLEPGKPAKPQADPPFWSQPVENDLTGFIESLAEEQWRVNFIRKQIAHLKLKSKARSRIDLIRQLVEGFLDPDRFSRQLNTLNDEEQRYYLYLLLHTNLLTLRTEPVSLDRLLSLSKPSASLTRRILDAGLGLTDEEGQFFVPYEMFKLLPPVYIPFDTEPSPAAYVPAADPRLLLTQVHQLLGLVQSGTYRTGPRPRWRMPRMGYYGTEYQTWPPMPDDAQRLLNNPNQQGAITLCPPAPYLDEDTLAAWSADLELTPDNVEFLYHVLINGQLLLPGSPVTLNTALIQPWMMQTPGDQLTTLYHIYRSLADWTDWWPDWRAGDVKVQWNYQNYWMLSSVDNMLRTTHYMLRWVILDVLAYLPHDVWLSADKVVQFLVKLYPEPKSHYYQHGLLCKDVHNHWKGFLAQTLRAMLRGPMYILGFVEVAPDLDTIEVFRLRHFQSFHWNRPEAVLVEDVTPFDRDAIAFEPSEQALLITPPSKAEFLIAVQQWSEPRGLVDNKLRYQLDVSRLHKAFEQGETPETFAEAWERHADFPPLPEIQQWWQTWWERYGHIRLYTEQTTLVTRDEFTMQELQIALPSMRDAIMGLVTPRVALLQAEDADRIVSDLERQGYMPKEET